MVMPDATRSITGSLVALDAKSIKRDDAGRLVANGNGGNDRLKWVGIGAGGGLLISMLTKTNALVDTLLGAGAGYLYDMLKQGKSGDVNLKAGTEFGVRLDRQLAFDTDRTDYYQASGNVAPTYSRYDAADNGNPSYDRGGNRRTEPGLGAEDIGLIVDDRNVAFGSPAPYMRGSQVLVPLASISRAASFEYRYDARRRMISVRNGALTMGVGSRIAVLNGERGRLPLAAEIRDGTPYVPLQFVGLATGGSAEWDADTRTVVVTTGRTR